MGHMGEDDQYDGYADVLEEAKRAGQLALDKLQQDIKGDQDAFAARGAERAKNPVQDSEGYLAAVASAERAARAALDDALSAAADRRQQMKEEPKPVWAFEAREKAKEAGLGPKAFNLDMLKKVVGDAHDDAERFGMGAAWQAMMAGVAGESHGGAMAQWFRDVGGADGTLAHMRGLGADPRAGSAAVGTAPAPSPGQKGAAAAAAAAGAASINAAVGAPGGAGGAAAAGSAAARAAAAPKVIEAAGGGVAAPFDAALYSDAYWAEGAGWPREPAGQLFDPAEHAAGQRVADAARRAEAEAFVREWREWRDPRAGAGSVAWQMGPRMGKAWLAEAAAARRDVEALLEQRREAAAEGVREAAAREAARRKARAAEAARAAEEEEEEEEEEEGQGGGGTPQVRRPSPELLRKIAEKRRSSPAQRREAAELYLELADDPARVEEEEEGDAALEREVERIMSTKYGRSFTFSGAQASALGREEAAQLLQHLKAQRAGGAPRAPADPAAPLGRDVDAAVAVEVERRMRARHGAWFCCGAAQLQRWLAQLEVFRLAGGEGFQGWRVDADPAVPAGGRDVAGQGGGVRAWVGRAVHAAPGHAHGFRFPARGRAGGAPPDSDGGDA
jgi:colicin import membrane protein